MLLDNIKVRRKKNLGDMSLLLVILKGERFDPVLYAYAFFHLSYEYYWNPESASQ